MDDLFSLRLGLGIWLLAISAYSVFLYHKKSLSLRSWEAWPSLVLGWRGNDKPLRNVLESR